MQLITGMFFTMFSLIVISSTTKKTNESNMTTKMNVAFMEDEADDYERLDPVTQQDGKVLT